MQLDELITSIIDHTLIALAKVDHTMDREKLEVRVELDSGHSYRAIHLRVIQEHPGDADDDFVLIATVFDGTLLRIDLFEGWQQFEVFKAPC
jgi:hypothetical protein